MTIFDELENKIRQSKANYSLTDDGQGKKTYIIFSEELKQSLRDVIHATAQEGEWQINHTVGTDSIKYRKKQDRRFGFYKKSLAGNSPDEFMLLAESQGSEEKKDFEDTTQRMAESRQRMAESRQRMAESRQRMAESRQSSSGNAGYQFTNETSHISYTGDSDILKEALGILAREQNENNQSQQQAQICQEEQPKLPFWKDWGKK